MDASCSELLLLVLFTQQSSIVAKMQLLFDVEYCFAIPCSADGPSLHAVVPHLAPHPPDLFIVKTSTRKRFLTNSAANCSLQNGPFHVWWSSCLSDPHNVEPLWGLHTYVCRRCVGLPHRFVKALFRQIRLLGLGVRNILHRGNNLGCLSAKLLWCARSVRRGFMGGMFLGRTLCAIGKAAGTHQIIIEIQSS